MKKSVSMYAQVEDTNESLVIAHMPMVKRVAIPLKARIPPFMEVDEWVQVGMVGLIVASIVNIFLGSDTVGWVISCAGVLIFAGLTAYDTQRIKSEYFYLQGTEMIGKAAVMGALTLYLDFINMFQFLLSFLGNRE